MDNLAASGCDPRPNPNTDISGIGVRVAFYLQCFLLLIRAQWAKHAEDFDEAILSLEITNMLYCAVTLIMGFVPNSTISLYDGLVICYLLGSALFVSHQVSHTVTSSGRRSKVSAAQSFIVFATLAIILFTAASFGSNAQCNSEIMLSLFIGVKLFDKGRELLLFALALAIGSYTTSLFRANHANRARHHVWKIVSALVFLSFLLNTELLRLYNHVQPEDLSMGWGQAIALLTTLFPLKSAASAFGILAYVKRFLNRPSRVSQTVRLEGGDRRLTAREDIMTGTRSDGLNISAISQLYEYMQQRDGHTANLKWEADRTGPDHAPQWIANWYVDGEAHGRGEGSTKKAAQDFAARETLRMLRSDDPHSLDAV
ncbi:hypothetical protein PUNSTDRAFT_120822 [Punctularia strigosozonata HHB-11173 SS5]|uniref:uncharacterized protein n=1 Tax=Punctularia strigosozonata (strain HHB-11173) TaxID=741275 RepID=UPI0004417991|nr:uncharacterized protein PUNSTDRAFT_120822 [Punctularia strigosozonata HHB-11173 SS5]EIN08487.1 hypothetical protein PUNSTDRAFT_120822 [Punctularia strigosozonata HHB-11173 SS5]